MTDHSIDIPLYTVQEQDLVINSLMSLKKEKIQSFLESIKLHGGAPAKKGTILEAISTGTLNHATIIAYLDQIEPWGKQHVHLYNGPVSDVSCWRDPEWIRGHLTRLGLEDLLGSQVPLALPETLTLSAIEANQSRLRITAVERREGALREPDLDKKGEILDTEIIYKAYIYKVVRGFTVFEWDLTTNHAFLQITQLPSGQRYEEAVNRFFELIEGVLRIQDFAVVDLRNVITRLHELEESGVPETRSHGIGYRTLMGRTLTGKSSAGMNALFGEPVIDDAMSSIRKVGVGHLGNFYWLPSPEGETTSNPLDDEVHVELIGESNRVNFMTSSCEEAIRYVLQRIRFFSN